MVCNKPKYLDYIAPTCELVRRPDSTSNRGTCSTESPTTPVRFLNAGLQPTQEKLVVGNTGIYRGNFRLGVDFLQPRHCLELFDRGVHRYGLLEDVG